MVTIAEIADRIGEHICQQAGLHENQNKVCFGIEILLIMSITAFVSLAIAMIFGLFFETIAIMVAALGMKFIIGSPHLSGFSRCLIYCICLSMTGALLTHTADAWLSVPIIFFILGTDWIVLSVSPLLLSYRTLEKPQILSRKILAGSLIGVTALLVLVAKNLWTTGFFIGSTIAAITISTVHVRLIRWIDDLTKCNKSLINEKGGE